MRGIDADPEYEHKARQIAHAQAFLMGRTSKHAAGRNTKPLQRQAGTRGAAKLLRGQRGRGR